MRGNLRSLLDTTASGSCWCLADNRLCHACELCAEQVLLVQVSESVPDGSAILPAVNCFMYEPYKLVCC